MPLVGDSSTFGLVDGHGSKGIKPNVAAQIAIDMMPAQLAEKLTGEAELAYPISLAPVIIPEHIPGIIAHEFEGITSNYFGTVAFLGSFQNKQCHQKDVDKLTALQSDLQEFLQQYPQHTDAVIQSDL